MTSLIRAPRASALLEIWESTPYELRGELLTYFREQEALEDLFFAADGELGTPYGLWADDPVGFICDGLGEALWLRQREIAWSARDNEFTAVPSCFASGKCAWEHDTLALADGTVSTFGDLVGREFRLHTWDENGRSRVRQARAVWNATEPVYRLTTSSGRTVVRNAQHPLYAAHKARKPRTKEHGYTPGILPTVRGWTPLGQLQRGDLVLIPEQHPAEGTASRPIEQLALIGYLLGDGGTTVDVRFTQQPGPALDEFRRCTELLGGELVKLSRPYDWAVRGRTRGSNPILTLATAAGLRGCKARDKRIPEWAWRLRNQDLAVILGRLFACDAWVHMRETKDGGRAGEVGICLASEQLIRDVERGMLRLGVWGRVRHRTVTNGGGRRFDAWEWLCRDEDALLQLSKSVEIPGKQDALHTAVAFLQGRSRAKGRPCWERRNAPPGYRWDTVSAVEQLPGLHRTVAVEVDGEHTFITGLVEHNTHLLARLVCWWVCVHPVGTAKAVTTASRMRQVITQLWPHIRRLQATHNLPGKVDAAQWYMPGSHGGRELVAYGFTPPAHEPEAVQGIHEPHVFVGIDEAGLINPRTGQAWLSASTGAHTRVVATGNPPTDEEDSWLELISNSLNWNPLPIEWPVTPNYTGEATDRCRSCVDWRIREHRIGDHLISPKDVKLFANDYGEDSAFYLAKVMAMFVKGAANKTIPSAWIAKARIGQKEGPEQEDVPKFMGPKARIRLGVDTAQGGGDELVVARRIGRLGRVVRAQRGEANRNTFDVAGYILEEIEKALILERKIGKAVRPDGTFYGIDVVIDITGDRGPVDTLKAWKSEGRIPEDVHILAVNFGEGAYERDRYLNRRAELWWNTRMLLQPDDNDETDLVLIIDNKSAGQLADPKYKTNSSGKIQLESKDDLKARGRPSPDRGDALCLMNYDPPDIRDDEEEHGLLGSW